MFEHAKQVPLGFATKDYPAGTHMCLIHNSEQQRRDVMAKYVQAGLKSGEKVGYVSDIMQPAQVQEWLVEQGVEIPDNKTQQQLSIFASKDFYYPDGTFAPEDMFDRIGAFYQQAVNEGYTAFRGAGEMSWARKNIKGSNRLIEYENSLNKVLDKYKITAICQYDTSLFDTETILNVLQTHPVLIMYGTVMPSPYYREL
jgi:hypothetical protein